LKGKRRLLSFLISVVVFLLDIRVFSFPASFFLARVAFYSKKAV